MIRLLPPRSVLLLALLPFALVFAACDSGSDDEDSGFFGVGFEGTTLSQGSSLNATLSSSDNRASDFSEEFTDGPVDDEDDTFIDVYRLNVGEGQRVISMTSSDFDTFLVLFELDGDLVDADDDGGAGFNARMVTDLDAGTYVLVATSFSDGETGSYSLSVQ